MNAEHICDVLKNRGHIDNTQADDILDEVKNTGDTIFHVLKNFGLFEDDAQIYQIVAEDLGASFMDLKGFKPPVALLEMIPPHLARLHGALPINFDDRGLHVALVDPLNPQTLEDLRFAVGKDVQLVIARPDKIEDLINESYGAGGEDLGDILAEFGEADPANTKDLEAEANSAPIVRYVDLVLYQAIKERASDIHFEPFDKEFKIRYRVDGALLEIAPPPARLSTTVISRIKVMGNLNIAERRLPQDGRIMKTVAGRPVDMRVSTLPTIHGESVVLRVLDRQSSNLDLSNLGMPKFIYDYVNQVIVRPNGIFIVTGPTGSGKTTTLYACLKRINTIDAKLLTVEDPVEYDIDGIIQVPVNENIGVTFAKVLRAFLRQDPDRIMVGEIRDAETGQIAIQASLTGHLVLTTLHTNDAPGAVTRLVDMGLEPFLVSASLEGVLAQRLIRTICKECKVSYEPTDAILTQLGISPHEIGDKHFLTGEGCEECGQSGYHGRKGLYELLNITDPIRDMITERTPTVVLKQKAIELGLTTLREDGLRNIYEGYTTIEEVLKYT
ncbi:MAG: GspE/PulE family protein [Verrucomicrobiales bacterium]